MLIGIVVNNAIVLVDYVNLLRRERKLDVTNAVIESGRLRLRPILMTTGESAIAEEYRGRHARRFRAWVPRCMTIDCARGS